LLKEIRTGQHLDGGGRAVVRLVRFRQAIEGINPDVDISIPGDARRVPRNGCRAASTGWNRRVDEVYTDEHTALLRVTVVEGDGEVLDGGRSGVVDDDGDGDEIAFYGGRGDGDVGGFKSNVGRRHHRRIDHQMLCEKSQRGTIRHHVRNRHNHFAFSVRKDN
jgi:hypothetical protein